MNAEPLARLRGITKRFGRNEVLRDVSLDVYPGEVHVLAGENGAGKSTLIRILGGVYTDFEGTVDAPGGVAVIHQELSLVESMSVADNLFLGRAPTAYGMVRAGEQRARARALLERLGLAIDPDSEAGRHPIAVRQLIEIGKALGRDARTIVMDEPTSALNAPEVERLFGLIAEWKREGRGIVYITHRMEEIERIADRVTVLRDGAVAGTAPAASLPAPRLIEWMLGRKLEEQFPAIAQSPGAERLRLEGYTVPGSVEDVSITVRAGEIVGLAGLQGSGASQLLLSLFGAGGPLSRGRVVPSRGRVLLDGQPLAIGSPRDAIRNRIALLTNDRKATGLVLSMSLLDNAALAGVRELAGWGGWRRPRHERAVLGELLAGLRLRAASPDAEAGTLSGGNQQKVALAKWLHIRPGVLLLDEPTRGVDVGAKREIYELMREWTAHGAAIVMTSSELPELLALAGRVVAMHRGRVIREFARGEATPEAVLQASMGRAA